MREHGTLHIPDVRAQNDFPTLGSVGGLRTFLAVPLRQQGELIGSLNARRIEVRPFTPAQIKLLETFADQAVIAIENVRLFQELKESLEQQTATSEILGVIASSPTDIQPVLDTVAENAARLCDADDALHSIASMDDVLQRWRLIRVDAACRWRDRPYQSRIDSLAERLSTGKRSTFTTLRAESTTEFPDSRCRAASYGTRTVLATPLLREGSADWRYS